MKILFLPNWHVKKTNVKIDDLQSQNYYIPGMSYWFFVHFANQVDIDVIDMGSIAPIEHLEQYGLRFYVIQALRAIPKLNQYDVVISHSVQSGLVLAIWRRLFKTRAKHLVFDIGSFNSAAEGGMAQRMMQWASKSFDGLIYHTSTQIDYYKKFYPWLVEKAYFIRFGTDMEYFRLPSNKKVNDKKYIICVGYEKRDWDTLIEAYSLIDTNVKLRLVGHVEEKYKGIPGVEQIPYMPIKELMIQIREAQFGVLPLKKVNYSYGQMTLLQQMALEKCVLAAKVPSLQDYIVENETALFYEPSNVENLREKINWLLDNPSIAVQIGRNARRYLEIMCNEKIMAKDVEKVVVKILKQV